MNKENVNRYLTALRSGEYLQCQDGFFNKEGGSYCAIGVGLDLMVQEGLGKWVPIYPTSKGYKYIPIDQVHRSVDICYVYAVVLSKWLDCNLSTKVMDDLYALNDDMKLSLPQMADEIEKVLGSLEINE
jgi:hypothetical protein